MDEHQKRLVDYVNRQVALGVDKDIIIKALRDIGWPQDRIDASFASLNESRASRIDRIMGSPIMNANKLPPATDLFARAWGIFKSRLGVLLALSFISFILSIVAQLPEALRLSGLASLMILIISSILSFLTGAALVYAVANHAEKLGFSGAYQKASKNFWGFAWISFLVGLIVAGGFGLLIVPGIIFSVWFSLAIWVFAVEGVRGMNALLKSKEYARMFFGAILWRLAFLMLIPIVIILPVVLLSLFLSPFLALIIIPLMILMTFIYPGLASAYMYLLFKDIKALKGGDVQYVATTGRKAKFIFMGFVGLVAFISLPIILTIAAMNFSNQFADSEETLSKARDTQRISDLATLKTAISLYQSSGVGRICEVSGSYSSTPDASTNIDGTGWLPIDFTKIPGGSPISELPVDPGYTYLSSYRYHCDVDDQTYELNAYLESQSLSYKAKEDGGNDQYAYEVGTDLMLRP